ncbi:MAG TPA: hypothetical protein EYO04_03490 [Candidatus Marinimicrobia bacterium]|nr:hypothetical protein [Candidatus Neomarinimicrobiota bacterium]
MKGKKTPVKAYELLSLKNELPDEKAQLVKAFDEGIDLYHNQDWLKAKKRFKDALSLEEEFPYRPTTPSAVYIERCEHFKKNPPKKDWDGVWTMTTK